jgi:hypothetical protein
MTLEEMEAKLCCILDLTRQYREALKPRFGNDSISDIKVFIGKQLNYDKKILKTFNDLEISVLSTLDELDAVLTFETIEYLKQTELFKSIYMDDQLYDDLLNCCVEAPFSSIDRRFICNMTEEEIKNTHISYMTGEKFNIVQLIHKDFPTFLLFDHYPPMHYGENRLYIIDFFVRNNCIDKELRLIYFISMLCSNNFYNVYESAMFLWNNHLINLMESVEEAIGVIKNAIDIAATGERFEIYKQLIYSVQKLYPKFDVYLLFGITEEYQDTTKSEIKFKYAIDMIKKIILSGKSEVFDFLFEFEKFESKFYLLIFDVIFNIILNNAETGKNLLDETDTSIEDDYMFSNGDKDLTYNRESCIKLITKLITTMHFPHVSYDKIIIFVGKTENPDYFTLIDLLITKGFCKMEDTHETFKTNYILKRNKAAFLYGYYHLIKDDIISDILDINMLSEMLTKC